MLDLRGEELLVVIVALKSFVILLPRSVDKTSTQYESLGCASVAGCLAFQVVAVLCLSHSGREKVQSGLFRPGVHHGAYCVLLVPLAVLAGTLRDYRSNSPLQDVMFLLMTGSMMLLLAPRMMKIKPGFVFYLLVLGSLTVPVLCFLQESASFTVLTVGVLCVVLAVLWLPKVCQKSFTLGELFVVSHLLAHQVWRIFKWLRVWLFIEKELHVMDSYLYIFVSVIVVFVALASAVVLCMQRAHHIMLFVLIYTMFAVTALLTLQVITHFNPVCWFLLFIFRTSTQIQLLVWWFALAALTAIGMAAFSQNLTTLSEGGGSTRRVSALIRKAFHFVAVAAFMPGLAADPSLLLLASIVAFAVLIVLEVARLMKVQIVGPALESSFKVFADDKDKGPVLLTHIYLLVGLSLPLWLAHSVHDGEINNYAGVVSLGIGDTFACLFGRAYGRIKWPGADKSVEGTGAAFVSQLMFVWLISYCGWASVTSWWNVAFVVLLTSVYEALATQIDNLVLPLVMMAVGL